MTTFQEAESFLKGMTVTRAGMGVEDIWFLSVGLPGLVIYALGCISGWG
jgi:hypothetical protein